MILSRARPPLLIHYHIFKNAGTSFEWALTENFGDKFASFDTSSARGFISRRELSRFVARNPALQAISSHQAALPPPRIRSRQVLTSILIRDPIARIRSIYAFERLQKASSPGAIKAKELSFKEYIEWRLEDTPSVLCNYQVHFCIRTARHLTRPVNQEDLKQAILRLDQISIVGTVSRYDEWLTLAERTLSESFPGVQFPSTRRNATRHESLSYDAILGHLVAELGEYTAHYLLEHNQLDMCLYQVADALLSRKLAESNLGASLLRAYDKARQNRVNEACGKTRDVKLR